jgi:hypothetical protein
MATPAERQEWRRLLLERLFDASDGVAIRDDFDYRELTDGFGLTDASEADVVAQRLVDEGFAEWVAMGGQIGITPAGVEEEERRRAAGAADPELAVLPLALLGDVETFVSIVRGAIERGDLRSHPEEQAVAEADLVSVEAQLRSPRPKRTVIRTLVHGIKVVADDARAGVIGAAAFELLRKLYGV